MFSPSAPPVKRALATLVLLSAAPLTAAACSGAPIEPVKQPAPPPTAPAALASAVPVAEADAGDADAADAATAVAVAVAVEADAGAAAGPAACPAGMKLIDGDYCTEVEDKCLRS